MPSTEAGKRLLREHLDAAVYCGMPTGVFIDSIDAIEAEAVASMLTQQEHEDLCRDALVRERARIKAGVEKYIAHHGHEPGKNCVSAFCAAGLHAAVLRIVEGGG